MGYSEKEGKIFFPNTSFFICLYLKYFLDYVCGETVEQFAQEKLCMQHP